MARVIAAGIGMVLAGTAAAAEPMGMATALEDWAGTFLVADRSWLDTFDATTNAEKAEHERADRQRLAAMGRLTKERAKTPAELSAKVAIAIDWLRCDGFEHTMAILNSVVVDLRMMELQAAAEDDAEEEETPAAA